jgi:hypothetical protein
MPVFDSLLTKLSQVRRVPSRLLLPQVSLSDLNHELGKAAEVKYRDSRADHGPLDW